MTYLPLRVLATFLLAMSCVPTISWGQASAAPGGEPASAAKDCSRWAAAVFDEPSSSCVCPPGMWWNLRGDACLPREHAATQFCTTVWPGSQPYFVSGGGYRCVCAPPLLWDAQATACRPPTASGEADCTKEWPGTLPVISPSGTEFECRCPGGQRWDDGSRSCVAGAPVVVASRGFSNEGEVPPSAPAPAFAPPSERAPEGAAPSAPPAYVPEADEAGHDASRQPPVGIPPVKTRGNSAVCDALLAEIRGRAGAGQTGEADALGMKAAISGCDPAAISEASRAKPPAR